MADALTNLGEILTDLEEQMAVSPNAAYQAALKYTAIAQAKSSISGSEAKEITLELINTKLPNLSSGKIPVTIGSINLTADWRLLTETTVIPAGSCYVYLFVKQGDVTINGLTKTTGEYINLEPSPFARHPEINIVIPAGKSIELIRGY